MSNDTIKLYQPPKPTLRTPNPRKGDLIIEIPFELLVNTSSWAAQKHKDGTLFHSTTIPQGLDCWIVRNLLSWITHVSRKMGSEDPNQWTDKVTMPSPLGESKEVPIYELNITNKPNTFRYWLETYLAYTTHAIHGGPLTETRHFLFSKIIEVVDDTVLVLDIDDVVKDIANRELGKVILGGLVEGEGFVFPPKITSIVGGVEGTFGSVPELVLEGESSKGLTWRNARLGMGGLEKDRLHVFWRPRLRRAVCRGDVEMEDVSVPAACLGDVPELVEEPGLVMEPTSFLEDEEDGDEEWEEDFGENE
ncbi:hypothetical protein E2P81_ATG05932 [Venturia nashicola]|nr:hypothetical protein E2P81_ATG05932 [Venturia nashicola]